MPLSAVIVTSQRMLVLIRYDNADCNRTRTTQKVTCKGGKQRVFVSGDGASQTYLLECVYSGQISKYYVWETSIAPRRRYRSGFTGGDERRRFIGGRPDATNRIHRQHDDCLCPSLPVRFSSPPPPILTLPVSPSNDNPRLGRILGDISRQIYSINTLTRDSPLETAIRLTSELEKWKETVPPLFNSVHPSSLIPPLCRQSQVLQLAYSHAMIHVTRSFLLNDFTDLSRRPKVPHPMVSSHVQKCIQAAEDIMTIVDGLAQQGVLIQSFWFTHYVCFCAVLVVYIHTIQQHRKTLGASSSASVSSAASLDGSDKLRQLFSLAESCQQHLAEATRKNCPSRRYGIILEELRQEVHRQIGANGFSVEPRAHLFDGNKNLAISEKSPQHGDDKSVLFDAQTIDFPTMSSGIMQTADLGTNTGDDAGFLESFEGSIWWAQLDSWVRIRLSFMDRSSFASCADFPFRPCPTSLMTHPRLTFKRDNDGCSLRATKLEIAFNCKYFAIAQVTFGPFLSQFPHPVSNFDLLALRPDDHRGEYSPSNHQISQTPQSHP